MIKTEDYLRETLIIFFAQKKIIFGTTALIAVIAVLIAFFWPPSYEVSGSLLVKAKKVEKSPEAIESMDLRNFRVEKEDLFSEMALLTSFDVVKNTIATYDVDALDFLCADPDDTPVAALTGKITNSLRTEILPNTNIIRISLVNRAPVETQEFLNRLMHQYIEYRGKIYYPEGEALFYERQADKFKTALGTKETELQEMVAATGSTAPEKEIENNLAAMLDLEKTLNDLKNQWIEKKHAADVMQSAIAREDIRFFSEVDNPAISRFGDRLYALMVEKGTLLRKFHPDSTTIFRIREQIDETLAALKREVAFLLESKNTELDGLSQTMASIQERITALTQRNVTLSQNRIVFDGLRRDIDLLAHSYTTFAKRREEAKINTSTDAGSRFSVSLVNSPFFSDTPYFPSKKTVIPFGILAGVITGCCLGFLKEFFDHTFKTPEDVTRAVDLPVLFSIPKW